MLQITSPIIAQILELLLNHPKFMYFYHPFKIVSHMFLPYLQLYNNALLFPPFFPNVRHVPSFSQFPTCFSHQLFSTFFPTRSQLFTTCFSKMFLQNSSTFLDFSPKMPTIFPHFSSLFPTIFSHVPSGRTASNSPSSEDPSKTAEAQTVCGKRKTEYFYTKNVGKTMP